MIATEAETRLSEQVYAMIQNIAHRTSGMRVEMTRGKYAGREAEINGAIMNYDGQIAYLCMVLRANSDEPINGDCASRSYLPADYFRMIE